MQFEDVLNKRYSVRKFDGRKVEKEKVDAILNAARMAPTAKNNQPQRIFVLESGDALEKLKKSTIYHFNAPLAFLICYDNTLSWTRPFDGKDCGQVDAAIITTYMMLEATAQGLGTTWVGYLNPEVVRGNFRSAGKPHARRVFACGISCRGLCAERTARAAQTTCRHRNRFVKNLRFKRRFLFLLAYFPCYFS